MQGQTKKTYAKKLLDPQWQKKRLRIFERDEWECQVCGSKEKTLNVHHLNYGDGEPWEVPDEWLLTLCSECHEIETGCFRECMKEFRVALADMKGSSPELYMLLRVLQMVRENQNITSLNGFLTDLEALCGSKEFLASPLVSYHRGK